MIIFLIFLAIWFGLSLKSSYVIFGLLGIILLIYTYKRFGKKILPVVGLTFLLSYGVSYIQIDINAKKYDGVVIESKENYFLFKSCFQKFYVYEKNNEYEIGDFLSIKGYKNDLSFTKIESSFDFENYLNNKGVKYQLNTYSIKYNFKNPIRIKAGRNNFLSHFSESTKNVVSAILFSTSEREGVVYDINSLHIVKFVSSSGFYLYLFIKVIEFFLTIKIKKKNARLISLTILLPYVVFTFPRFNVLRFYAFSIFSWINKYQLNNKFTSFQRIAIIGLIFIGIDYHFVYSDSFILGFSFPIIFSYSNSVFDDNKRIIKAIKRTLLCVVFFLPFELKYYYSFAPLSNLYGALLTPIFSLIGIMSLISFFGLPIYKPIEFIINLSSKPISWLSKYSLEIYSSSFCDVAIVLYYMLLFAFIYYKYIGFKPVFKAIAISLFSITAIKLTPIRDLFIQRVSFINVGQGDSCLIQKGNMSILIDTGGLTYTDIATNCLIPFFKKNKIYDIDYLITTHDDFDHNGGVDSLIENFKVKNYINSYESFPLTCGSIKLENLNNNIDEASDNNESSLVLKFELLNKTFLLMGDAPIEVEKEIITYNPALRCDVLKVGHHGSKTSTCSEFIKSVQPKEAVISVGKNNKYGHPNEEVLEILEKYNVNIKRTDLNGTISYTNYIFM